MIDEVLICTILICVLIVLVVLWYIYSSNSDSNSNSLQPVTQYIIVPPTQNIQVPEVAPYTSTSGIGSNLMRYSDQSSSFNNQNDNISEMETDLLHSKYKVGPLGNKKSSFGSVTKSNLMTHHKDMDDIIDKRSTFANNPYANANDADEHMLRKIALDGQ